MSKLPPRDSWDSLPEVGGIGLREEIIDGGIVVVPFIEDFQDVFWFEEDDPPGFCDGEGRRWRFAKTRDGRWAKRRWG